MDTSEDEVLVAVRHQKEDPVLNKLVSNLYISGISGSKYVLSLENVLTVNRVQYNQRMTVIDIHKVGVLTHGMFNPFSPKSDQGGHSLLTFSLKPECKRLTRKTYMLFHGQEVRIEKNFARGLECTARAASARAAHSRPRAKFFSIRTDQGREITYLFFLLSFTKE